MMTTPSRFPPWIWLLLLGMALVLPRLGSYGFWEPQETNIADRVGAAFVDREASPAASAKQHVAEPPLQQWLVALSVHSFGLNEWAARLPIAIAALLSLMVMWYVGARLFGPLVGTWAALMFMTAPLFILQSRLLTSDLLGVLAQLAAVGGLLAYLSPVTGSSRKIDLVLSAAGFLGSLLTRGLLLGGVLPIGAIAIGLISVGSPGEKSSGAARRKELLLFAATLGVLFIGWMLWGPFLAGDRVWLWGVAAVERTTAPLTAIFVEPGQEIGYGMFPWVGLLPAAIALLTAGSSVGSPLARAVLLGLFLIGYLVDVLWTAFVAPITLPVWPWLALIAGIFVAEWSKEPVGNTLWALVAAVLIFVIQQDFFVSPETLAFVHLTDAPKFPDEMPLRYVYRVVGLVVAGIFFVLFLRRGETWGETTTDHVASRQWLRWCKATVRAGQRTLAWLPPERLLTLLVIIAVGSAAYVSAYMIPELSKHLSSKLLLSTYDRCKQDDEVLIQYLKPNRGVAYYAEKPIETISSQAVLLERLQGTKRIFVLAPSNTLAEIDRAARQGNISYAVVDDSSSTVLMLSNQLRGSCNEDKNPLRRYVSRTRPAPQRALIANFDNKVRLIGFDLDDAVTRGGKFKITFYYEVLAQMPSGYKVFVHFDQSAYRFNGDHEPLQGKYPTQYWLPGDFITDTQEVDIPIIVTPPGTYQVYMGFWLASARMKIVEGPDDGTSRLKLGSLQVR